jgi:MerR family copper efflux transcriptional regulator
MKERVEMATENSTVTMHIGELAENTGLSLRTIRHYDEIGLLKASGRTEGGFRLYTQEDLSRLILIRRMKPLGFALEEMMELLVIIDTLQGGSPGSDSPIVRSELDRFISDAEMRREKLCEQLNMADEFLDLLRVQ